MVPTGPLVRLELIGAQIASTDMDAFVEWARSARSIRR